MLYENFIPVPVPTSLSQRSVSQCFSQDEFYIYITINIFKLIYPLHSLSTGSNSHTHKWQFIKFAELSSLN